MSGWTLLLQVVNFVVLAWLLQRLLYRPLLSLAAERQARIDRAAADAEQRTREADELRDTHARRLQAIEAERDRLLAEGRAALAAESARARERAAAEARELRDAAGEQLAVERAAALAALESQSVELALDLAGRLLAETGGADADARLAERVLARLDTLPAAELDGLLAADVDIQAVTVASAVPLSRERRERIAEHLARRLGHAPVLHEATEPALLAGVEIRFANGALGATWRDALAAARQDGDDAADAG